MLNSDSSIDMNNRRKYTPLRVDDPSEASFCSRGLREDTTGVWRSICLALFLMMLGISFFILSILHATGHVLSDNGAGYGFLVLGILTFIPGFYHSRIAYYAWRGYKGYSFASIPTY